MTQIWQTKIELISFIGNKVEKNLAKMTANIWMMNLLSHQLSGAVLKHSDLNQIVHGGL